MGGTLSGARAGSRFMVDAHVVATGDPVDLGRLAAPHRNVHVVDIG